MARNEDIVNSIWEDLDDLSNDEMMLFVWSWTNGRCGMAGIYKCSRRNLLERRLGDEALTAALTELDRRRLVFFEDGVVWNRPRYKRLRQHGEKIARAAARDLQDIKPSHPLFVAFMQMYVQDPVLGPDLRAACVEKGVPIALGSTIDGLSDGVSVDLGSTRPITDSPSIALQRAPGVGAGEEVGAVVNQVLARLTECDRWTVNDIDDRQQVERLVHASPRADHDAAAAAAVRKGNDPKWRTRTAWKTFEYALREQADLAAPKPEARAADKSKYDQHLRAAS